MSERQSTWIFPAPIHGRPNGSQLSFNRLFSITVEKVFVLVGYSKGQQPNLTRSAIKIIELHPALMPRISCHLSEQVLFTAVFLQYQRLTNHCKTLKPVHSRFICVRNCQKCIYQLRPNWDTNPAQLSQTPESLSQRRRFTMDHQTSITPRDMASLFVAGFWSPQNLSIGWPTSKWWRILLSWVGRWYCALKSLEKVCYTLTGVKKWTTAARVYGILDKSFPMNPAIPQNPISSRILILLFNVDLPSKTSSPFYCFANDIFSHRTPSYSNTERDCAALSEGLAYDLERISPWGPTSCVCFNALKSIISVSLKYIYSSQMNFDLTTNVPPIQLVYCALADLKTCSNIIFHRARWIWKALTSWAISRTYISLSKIRTTNWLSLEYHPYTNPTVFFWWCGLAFLQLNRTTREIIIFRKEIRRRNNTAIWHGIMTYVYQTGELNIVAS